MSDIKLYGFSVSPHVRATRIAFHEKQVAIEFREIGLDHLPSAEYGAINPFRKMPALVHRDLTIYETPAILTYAEGMGVEPSLEPTDAAQYAKMWQFIGVAQNYLYPVGFMQIYFQNVLAGLFGAPRDPAIANAAIAPTAMHLDVLESALEDGALAGGRLSLADIYCGVMIDHIARTRVGRELVDARPKVNAWLNSLRARENFKATFAPMLIGTDQV